MFSPRGNRAERNFWQDVTPPLSEVRSEGKEHMADHLLIWIQKRQMRGKRRSGSVCISWMLTYTAVNVKHRFKVEADKQKMSRYFG